MGVEGATGEFEIELDPDFGFGVGVEQRDDLDELRRERRRWGEGGMKEGGSLKVCILVCFWWGLSCGVGEGEAWWEVYGVMKVLDEEWVVVVL